MQPHFADEWQRLTALYAEKSDEELLELSAAFADLTEPAQQVLRDELRKRRLPEPATPQLGAPPLSPDFGRQGGSTNETASTPREYTWKTLLCECRDQQYAWQLSTVLKDAGIESWMEMPRAELDLTGPRILVAADQLDEARAVADRPIPQDIVDQSNVEDEDFTPPSCPKCRAPDPLLLGVDPANTWRCALCGAQWTDSLAAESGDSQPAP